jgi:hypothetical protein
MVTGQVIAIVVLLGMVLAVAVAWAVFRRKNVAQRQIDATRYREEAASRFASAQRLEAEAAERADRARREQTQAAELAEMARRDRELAESRAAQAERLDPDGPWPTTPDAAPTTPAGDRGPTAHQDEQPDQRAPRDRGEHADPGKGRTRETEQTPQAAR